MSPNIKSENILKFVNTIWGSFVTLGILWFEIWNNSTAFIIFFIVAFIIIIIIIYYKQLRWSILKPCLSSWACVTDECWKKKNPLSRCNWHSELHLMTTLQPCQGPCSDYVLVQYQDFCWVWIIHTSVIIMQVYSSRLKKKLELPFE